MLANNYNFNIFNSLILAGLLQGFLFVYIVLSQKKYRVKSTYYLTALIFTFSYSNLIYYLDDVNIITYQVMHRFFMFPFPLITPVLFYFFVRYFLNPEDAMTFKEKLLFVPFILTVAFELTFKIPRILEIKMPHYFPLYDLLLLLIEFVGIIFSVIVFFHCYKKMLIRDREISASKIVGTMQRLGWLKVISIGLFILTVIWFVQLMYTVINDIRMAFYPLWIGMSVMIYYMGHVGIYKYGVQQERNKIRERTREQRLTYTSEKLQNERVGNFINYIAENKAYLNPNLSLDLVADAISVSKSHLSRTINAELDINFSDYINKLRVDEAKIYLENPDFAKYTLVAIGLEAGFNSKTTFNNCFKKFTGATPSEYRKSTEQIATS